MISFQSLLRFANVDQIRLSLLRLQVNLLIPAHGVLKASSTRRQYNAGADK